MVFNFQKAYIV